MVFFLELALELDQVEAFDLSPQPVHLDSGGVAFLTDLLHLPVAFFEARLVILALLEQTFVAFERDGWKSGPTGCLVPDDLTLEGILSLFGLQDTGKVLNLRESNAISSIGAAFGVKSALRDVAPDHLWLPVQDGRRRVKPDALFARVHRPAFYFSRRLSSISLRLLLRKSWYQAFVIRPP